LTSTFWRHRLAPVPRLSVVMTIGRVGSSPARLLVLLMVVGLVVGLVGGCASSPGPSPSSPATEGSSSAPAGSHSPAPIAPSPSVVEATPTPVASPAASCADSTLAEMTEAQRIGQLFNVGLDKDRLDATSRDMIVANHFGSVWYRAKTTIGVAGVRNVADAVQKLATPEATDRVHFFIAANQEGGMIQALAGPGFDTIPSAIDQGKLQPADLQARASRWGQQLIAAGVNMDFAPVADVVPPGTDAQNAPIGQLQRGYGHDPTTVASHVGAFIHGMRAAGVATTAKHFPGLGRVEGNTDFTSQVVDTVTTPDDPYLKPFARAATVHVPFVMVSLATYDRMDPDHLAAFSKTIIDTVLRQDLGYRGVVISDSLTADAVSDISPGQRAIDFIEAGGDMIVLGPIDVAVPMAKALAERASNEAAFRARIDQSALRILAAKEAAGLLAC
jgi:beta-N-acetylhexosaminidase